MDTQEKQALDYVLKSKHGRQFIWNILSECGIYQSIVGESDFVNRQLGKRDIGLQLLAKVSDFDDSKLFTMMKEAKERQDRMEKEHERKQSDREQSDGSKPNTGTGEYVYGDSGSDIRGQHESGEELSRHQYGGQFI